MRSNRKISVVFSLGLVLLPTLVFATTANPDTKSGNYNMTLLSLVCLMLILLFVIGMLAHTLRQLSFVVRDKMRKDKQAMSGTTKTILLAFALSIPAISSFAADDGMGIGNTVL